MSHPQFLHGTPLIDGAASGRVLWSDEGLSFWGGIEPKTGLVIDSHHPLHGESVKGRILCIPSGRGSCTGSAAMLELIAAGNAPAGMILAEAEEILPVGVMVGEALYGKSLPILRVARGDFDRLQEATEVTIGNGAVRLSGAAEAAPPPAPAPAPAIALSDYDRACLAGEAGPAAKIAMDSILRIAAILGAPRLTDITSAHIDVCIYTGPAGLHFAEELLKLGARFAVPTTLNAISVDRQRWQALGVAAEEGVPAGRLAECYVAMGADESFTCAPYLLQSAPKQGDLVSWGESNAVAFANSVLGARTMKTADFLDVFIAITGRAPYAGPLTDTARAPQLIIDLPKVTSADESLFPLAGYLCGRLSPNAIPLIRGLEAMPPDRDAMKAFGAAFATVSAAPMMHVAGMTPEAAGFAAGGLPVITVTADDLREAFASLDMAEGEAIDLVALGNPHLSLTEMRAIAALCVGRKRSANTALVLTCGRAIHAAAEAEGLIATIEAFGGQVLNDICWCMIGEPVIAPAARTILTNSGKYAHYGPGLTGRALRFGSLKACIDAAETGRLMKALPGWLAGL